jgi:hypothetical protein
LDGTFPHAANCQMDKQYPCLYFVSSMATNILSI